LRHGAFIGLERFQAKREFFARRKHIKSKTWSRLCSVHIEAAPGKTSSRLQYGTASARGKPIAAHFDNEREPAAETGLKALTYLENLWR
jgi:hypothetical protein